MTDYCDRIVRNSLIQAPRSRVWRALTHAHEFGRWFRVRLEGKIFETGQRIRGHVTYPGFEHLTWEVVIEEVAPEWRFGWRWHPAAVEAGIDYSAEPTTRVLFALDDAAQATSLTVTESGFDHLPEGRRASAFAMNSGGWDEQLKNIANHVLED